jgi:hypothetical protein
MGTKLLPGDFDCYMNAEPDEPMFVLLARDITAPSLVRAWAYQRSTAIDNGMRPASERAQVTEALQCAAAMVEWREKNRGSQFTVSEGLRTDDEAAP